MLKVFELLLYMFIVAATVGVLFYSAWLLYTICYDWLKERR